MGNCDLCEKMLLSHNEIFADIWNKLGRKTGHIDPEALTEEVTEQIYLADGVPKREIRDVAKRYHGQRLCIAILGIENQTEVDFTMPLRVMSYDCGHYRRQLNNHEPLVPAVTKVQYFGYKTRWTGPRSLREMMDIPADFDGAFQDYEIDVIEVAWLTDEERAQFHGSYRAIADFLYTLRTKHILQGDGETLEYPYEVFALIKAITGWDIDIYEIVNALKSKRGEIKMCDIIDQYKENLIAEHEALNKQKWIKLGKEDGFKLGKEDGFKLGKEDGFKLGKEDGFKDGMWETNQNVVKNMIGMNMSPDVISQATGLSREDIHKIMDEYKK